MYFDSEYGTLRSFLDCRWRTSSNSAPVLRLWCSIPWVLVLASCNGGAADTDTDSALGMEFCASPGDVGGPAGSCLLARSCMDREADETFDYRTTYTYDNVGNLVAELFEPDESREGKPFLYSHTYDADGNRLSSETDESADGTAEGLEYWTYDGDGNLLSYQVDADANGSIDWQELWVYDAEGRLAATWMEEQGESSWHSTFTYYINGKLRTEDHDRDGDGEVDFHDAYTYDPYGNVLTLDSWSRGYSDIFPYFAAYTYTYDSAGRVLTVEREADRGYPGDPVVDWYEEYTYDPSGRVGSWKRFDTMGYYDLLDQWTYTANGDVSTYEFQQFGYGYHYQRTERWLYHYDANDNLILFEVDEGADGTIDERTHYVWSC